MEHDIKLCNNTTRPSQTLRKATNTNTKKHYLFHVLFSLCNKCEDCDVEQRFLTKSWPFRIFKITLKPIHLVRRESEMPESLQRTVHTLNLFLRAAKDTASIKISRRSQCFYMSPQRRENASGRDSIDIVVERH